jgi:hypothetical protein
MNYRLGLRLDDLQTQACLPYVRQASPVVNQTVPRYCDATCYVLPTSNQGNEPACAGYATAGAVEVRRWRFEDQYAQVDGLNIYRRAKLLDGLTGDGTTVLAAIKAAQALHLLPEDLPLFGVPPKDRNAAKYAVHRFGGFIATWYAREDWAVKGQPFVGTLGSAVLGPHAVWMCGYDEHTIWLQNSWGEETGWHGLQKVLWSGFDADFLGGVALYGGWK